jgi:myxalamid-type polyketide synthase MxaE and MxaD
VGRLVRLPGGAPGRELAVRADASYLVTGGLGGLGLVVAEWLAARGATSLLLVGRSAPDDAASRTIDELRARGARVEVRAADVADERALRRVLDDAAGSLPPLRGVVHAAGVLADGLAADLDRTRLERVLAPKVAGAWNLHRLTASLPLEIFALFSSATAVLGAPGQANYAGANAYLDALAHVRRAAGLPGTSIDWGPWRDVGMAAGPGGAGQVATSVGTIAPNRGTHALEQVLRGDRAQVAVLPTDWARWRELFPAVAAWPLLRGVVPADVGEARDVAMSTDAAAALAASPAQRPALLAAFLVDETAAVMGLRPEELDADLPLTDLGLDSLMALELRNRVEAALDVELPIMQLVEGRSIAELTTELTALLARSPEPAVTP